jgi:ferredoxin
MHMVMDTAWSKCTCCNRCATYCPFGIDMGVMFGYLRGLCFAQGFVPWELKIGSGMHRIYNAQMDITTEDWVDTCEWMAEEYEEDWPGLEIPVDKEGRGYHLHGQRPGTQTLPGRPGRGGDPLSPGRRELDRSQQGWEETSLAMFAGDWGPARCRWRASTPPWIASSPNAWWSPSAATPIGPRWWKAPTGRDSNRRQDPVESYPLCGVGGRGPAHRESSRSTRPKRSRSRSPTRIRATMSETPASSRLRPGDHELHCRRLPGDDGPTRSTTSAAAAAADSTVSALPPAAQHRP